MRCHGRGHPHPVWAAITKAAKAAQMDAGSDGGEARPGQKLSGRRGAGEKEHLHRQFGDHCAGVRDFAFKTVDQTLAAKAVSSPSQRMPVMVTVLSGCHWKRFLIASLIASFQPALMAALKIRGSRRNTSRRLSCSLDAAVKMRVCCYSEREKQAGHFPPRNQIASEEAKATPVPSSLLQSAVGRVKNAD